MKPSCRGRTRIKAARGERREERGAGEESSRGERKGEERREEREERSERGQDSRERRSAPPLFAPALRSKATTLGPVCLKPHLVLAAALLVRVALAIS